MVYLVILEDTESYRSNIIQIKKDVHVVKTAQWIIGTELPSLDTAYVSRLHTKASSIIVDHTHPGNRMFVSLPSGKRYRVLKYRTNRLKNSFFAKAVSVLTPPITCSIYPQ